MRYLVISDVHGNLEALQAVLSSAPPYDAVLNLGDLVGYGPNPNEVIETVRALPLASSLAGNHDLAAVDALDLTWFNPVARDAALWTSSILTPGSSSYLKSLESSTSAHSFYLAHASPLDPVWEYMESPSQGPPNFAAFCEPVALVGHTHVPRLFMAGDLRTEVTRLFDGDTVPLHDGTRRILNPGGVGQPRDGDPRASFALLDSDAGTFTVHRVTYPIAVTQAKIRAAGLPPTLASRLSYGQ